MLIGLIGCQEEGELSIENKELIDNCNNCPNVEIIVPNITTETDVASSINTTIENKVVKIFSFGENTDAATYQEAIDAFKKDFKELKEQFPDETIGWEATIDGTVTYQSTNVLTVKLESYLFTGGAHGYSATTYLNFDKRSGQLLELHEMFDDVAHFTNFAETKFRIQENIPQNKNINTTGFMFENDVFHLPENIGYTKTGLQLVYNQYEIASYAEGQKMLQLMYQELQTYLKVK